MAISFERSGAGSQETVSHRLNASVNRQRVASQPGLQGVFDLPIAKALPTASSRLHLTKVPNRFARRTNHRGLWIAHCAEFSHQRPDLTWRTSIV